MRGEVGSVRAELIMWVIEEERPTLRRSLYQLGLQPERPAAETVRVWRIAFSMSSRLSLGPGVAVMGMASRTGLAEAIMLVEKRFGCAVGGIREW